MLWARTCGSWILKNLKLGSLRIHFSSLVRPFWASLLCERTSRGVSVSAGLCACSFPARVRPLLPTRKQQCEPKSVKICTIRELCLSCGARKSDANFWTGGDFHRILRQSSKAQLFKCLGSVSPFNSERFFCSFSIGGSWTWNPVKHPCVGTLMHPFAWKKPVTIILPYLTYCPGKNWTPTSFFFQCELDFHRCQCCLSMPGAARAAPLGLRYGPIIVK